MSLTAKGKKLSKSDQLCNEADESLQLRESRVQGIVTDSLRSVTCGSGEFSCVGVECRCGLKLF